MSTRGLLSGGLLVLALSNAGSMVATAEEQASPATVPDLSGGWLLLDTSGSGSFDGTAANFPPPELTAAGKAIAERGDGRNLIPAGGGSAPAHSAGEAYIVNNGACTPEGTGGSAIEPNSTAFFILQGKDEVLLTREGPGGRHFFMDGRPHPDPATYNPSRYGHSIGHYEGAALVVETVGLSAGSVPGGGHRTPKTRLIERYELSADGKRMTITYTWDDPAIYVRPYTYQHQFERLPAGSYALETWCDSSDPLQRQSIVPPEQVK
jgi:hypothetical protein